MTPFSLSRPACLPVWVCCSQLAALIEEATSASVTARAREVGAQVRAEEDGLQRCVEQLEALDRRGGRAFWADLRAAELQRLIRRQRRRSATAWVVVLLGLAWALGRRRSR